MQPDHQKRSNIAAMSRLGVYVTWGILFIIAMRISSLSRVVSRLRDEVEEFRRELIGYRGEE
jgi:hypothetical protein